MQGAPDAKKPCKGILKSSSSFDRHPAGASYRKSAKFDEFNILQTYHPPDKDYGHMKIEEPKTPYNYADTDPDHCDELDAELLAEKLRVAATSRTSFDDDYSSEEDIKETEEQKEKRLEFERRRRAHYKEYEAVRLARKLIEEEEDDEDDELNKELHAVNSDNKTFLTTCKDMDVDLSDDGKHSSSSRQ